MLKKFLFVALLAAAACGNSDSDQAVKDTASHQTEVGIMADSSVNGIDTTQ